MMMQEFIERTGFEPTSYEYREIEEEYYGADVDKDAFCKTWKKNGGVQRLTRRRATRIEDLEAKLAKQERENKKLVEELNKKYIDLQSEYYKDVASLKATIKEERESAAIQSMNTNQYTHKLESQLAEEKDRAKEAERKLAVLKEAMQILGIGAAEA